MIFILGFKCDLNSNFLITFASNSNPKMNSIQLNINRLNHLMSLYGLTKDDILFKLNEKRKTALTETDIFNDEIKISYLKKIDEIFNKGLSYYIDPKNPIKNKEESIFFRKDNFNADLNLSAKQIVNKFEEEKISFSALAKLSDFKLKRILNVYNLTDNPKDVANELRKILYPNFNSNVKEFLKNIITKLSEYNILVFEFIESPNKKEKANINGFYLSPNVIVLKRNQNSLRRELFTLIHELGHYLIDKEEIDDKINGDLFEFYNTNDIEKWCNDFAYFFLIGEYDANLKTLNNANNNNDYYHSTIELISQKTHLSTLSLYTRLLINNSISYQNYNTISHFIIDSIRERERQEKEKLERERQKAIEEGRMPSIGIPKPIISPLYSTTLQNALYSGLINEAEFCKKLNISSNKIERYLI